MDSGSPELRSLYLDASEVGVPWLLDPDSAALSGLRAAAFRSADDPCDAGAVVADVPDLLVLLRERHFGLATGKVPDPGLDSWAADWCARITVEQPSTWGAVLGAAFHQLRQLIGDRHLSAVGEDPRRLRALDPRGDEPVLGQDPGAPVSEEVTDGVLALRLRSFQHLSDGESALVKWRDAHASHFAHDRIVVDVRGNPGGGSIFARDWISEHVPGPFAFVPGQRWLLNGHPLIWNAIVGVEAVKGVDAVPAHLREIRPAPGLSSVLTVDAERWCFATGTQPWHGRMLVLTDRHTASAGEAVAWLLHLAFGARIAGRRSAGAVTFGDIVPYLLPRSGLQVMLASRWDGFPAVELVGLPVEIDLDPRTPLTDVTRSFDDLHPPSRGLDHGDRPPPQLR